jgi:hypothetical protein
MHTHVRASSHSIAFHNKALVSSCWTRPHTPGRRNLPAAADPPAVGLKQQPLVAYSAANSTTTTTAQQVLHTLRTVYAQHPRNWLTADGFLQDQRQEDASSSETAGQQLQLRVQVLPSIDKVRAQHEHITSMRRAQELEKLQ